MANKGIGSPNNIRKKYSYYHELITTCYHEAGHTISSICNFMPVSDVGVDIVIDKRTQKDFGYTNYDSALEYEKVTYEGLLHYFVISEISILYAGLAADQIFYKETYGIDKLPKVLSQGYGSDTENIHAIVVKYNLAPPGKARYAFKKKLLNKTRKLLSPHWDDVKLLAHTLFRVKKLYWNDLKLLLTTKSKNKSFWKKQFKDIELVLEAGRKNDQKFISSVYNR